MKLVFHRYRMLNRWTGNLGAGTSTYTAYARDFEMSSEGKIAPIACSSDPHFRGDGSRYNPEELLVGALSSCHMLWVLHLCADAGIVVTEYTDNATGEMAVQPDGSGEFTRVLLRPKMKITDPGRAGEAQRIHDHAHEMCFLARSMRFPVDHQAEISA